MMFSTAVRADRREVARYGLNVSDVMEVVSTAVGGEAVTNVLDGQRRYSICSWLAWLIGQLLSCEEMATFDQLSNGNA